MARLRTNRRLMTADEFFDWANRPENDGKHYDLVRGEVEEVSRPGERHGRVCSNGVFLFNVYIRRRRRGRILANDTGIILERDPDTVRGPDIALYDEIKPFEELNPKFAEDIPRLVVEVLSPTDRIGKVMRRINDLLRAGVQLVWLIDPEDRNVTVHRADRPCQVVEEGEELTGEDVLPDLRIAVADFFYWAGADTAPPGKKAPKKGRK